MRHHLVPNVWRAISTIVTLAAAGPVLAAPDGFLWAAGPVAEAQRAHFLSILGWMAVVCVPLLVALPLVLWRYRLGGAGRYHPEWGAKPLTEAALWALPVVVVSVLGWNLWRETHAYDPYRALGPDPVAVEVIAAEGHMLFLYPDDGMATVDRLIIEAERPARLRLTSVGVLRSLMVPRLAGQIYAMPGMTTELNLAAFSPGTYAGLNTQYSGPLFPFETFETEALEPGDRAARVDAILRDAPALPDDILERIAAGEVADAYAGAGAGLFAQVAGHAHGAHP